MIIKTLSQMGGLPKIRSAFNGWTVSITVVKVVQTVQASGFIQNSLSPITFKGVVQPLSPEQIALKTEGQRSWQWLQIHCTSGSLNLKNNDKIMYNGKRYKVMANKDYSLEGYIEYHVIEDYENV